MINLFVVHKAWQDTQSGIAENGRFAARCLPVALSAWLQVVFFTTSSGFAECFCRVIQGALYCSIHELSKIKIY